MISKNYAKRDAVKNYFPLPNELYSLNLSAGEIAVYSYLMYCEDRHTHQCYPSYETIGKSVNLSKNTVRKHVKSLEGRHLIKTEPTEVILRDGRKRNGSLLYTILPVGEAVNYNFDYQMKQNAKKQKQERILQMQEKILG